MMRALIVWLATALSVSPAFAQEAVVVDQVERLDTEAGETEFELQSIFADETAAEEKLQLHIFSGEYGLTDRVSVGFELQAEAEGDENLSADILLAQVKAVLVGDEVSPLRFGAQLSAGPSLESGSGEAELELLAEGRFQGITFAGDIMVEKSFDEDDAAFGYALRSDWRQDWGAFALEAGGDLADREAEGRRHWIGPVVELGFTERFALEFSYLRGLTSETPDDQFRLQLMVRR